MDTAEVEDYDTEHLFCMRVMIGPGKQALSEHGLGLRLTWSMNAVWAAEAQYLLGTFCLWDIY